MMTKRTRRREEGEEKKKKKEEVLYLSVYVQGAASTSSKHHHHHHHTLTNLCFRIYIFFSLFHPLCPYVYIFVYMYVFVLDRWKNIRISLTLGILFVEKFSFFLIAFFLYIDVWTEKRRRCEICIYAYLCCCCCWCLRGNRVKLVSCNILLSFSLWHLVIWLYALSNIHQVNLSCRRNWKPLSGNITSKYILLFPFIIAHIFSFNYIIISNFDLILI